MDGFIGNQLEYFEKYPEELPDRRPLLPILFTPSPASKVKHIGSFFANVVTQVDQENICPKCSQYHERIRQLRLHDIYADLLEDIETSLRRARERLRSHEGK
jgi:hypothetical protein